MVRFYITTAKHNAFLMFCTVSLLVVWGHPDNVWASDFVTVAGEEIPVMKEPETLIVGVDPDKIFRRYISDFHLFERSIMGPTACGVTIKWGIPKPRYTTWEGMRAAWSMKRDPRYINLAIGVFPSHREALAGAADYYSNLSEPPEAVRFSAEDPGFVSWTMPGSFVCASFVRDNVFVHLAIADELDPHTFVENLKSDLRNGAEGVLRGEKVERPVIVDPGYPQDFSLKERETAIGTLEAIDPNGRKLYRRVWMDLSHLVPGQIYRVPTISTMEWRESGKVEILPNDAGSFTLELRAVVVNDLFVVSDVWSKSVRVSVAGSAEP
ncbi:MAG: hypothetical protein ABIH23_31415 [bacterium]